MRIPKSIRWILNQNVEHVDASQSNTEAAGYSNPGTFVGSIENFTKNNDLVEAMPTEHYPDDRDTRIFVKDRAKVEELVSRVPERAVKATNRLFKPQSSLTVALQTLQNTTLSKIAFVTYDASLATLGGGITSAPRYVEKCLKQCDPSIESSMISIVTGRANYFEDDIAAKFIQIHWTQVDFSQCDYVFFMYPASAFMREQPDILEKVLSTVKCKFGVLIHDEYELDEKFKPVIQQYFDHPNLDFVQYISPKTVDMWRAYYTIPENVREFVAPCFPPGIDTVDYSSAATKEFQIVNTARIVSRKKIVQLLQITPYLEVPVKIFGILQPGIYQVQLNNNNFDKYYLGMYPDGTFPSRDSWFTWNIVLINRGYTARFAPRVELGIIESLRYGSLPILAKESLPEPIASCDYPLIFSWFEELGNMSLSHEYKAKLVNDRLEKIRQMSVEERLKMSSDFLKLILENIDYMPVYQDIAKIIMNKVNNA